MSPEVPVLTDPADIAREALADLLEATVAAAAFPLERGYLEQHRDHAETLGNLANEGRYLVRAVAPVPWTKARRRRLAITVPGVFALDTPLARREQAGLTALFGELQLWTSRFSTGETPISEVRERCAWSVDPPSVARWTTQLVSPRLSGQYPSDRSGYLGYSSGFGVADPATGFYESLELRHAFLKDQPPERVTDVSLLPMIGRVVETPGVVYIDDGPFRLATIRTGMGARCLAELVAHAGKAIHVLDLHAATAGLATLPVRVPDLPFLESLPSFEQALLLPADAMPRLRALARRVELLENLALDLDEWQPHDRRALPKWAKGPAGQAAKLRAALGEQFRRRELRRDFPLIWNAQTALRRAVLDVLRKQGLGSWRTRIEFGERFRYTRPAVT